MLVLAKKKHFFFEMFDSPPVRLGPACVRAPQTRQGGNFFLRVTVTYFLFFPRGRRSKCRQTMKGPGKGQGKPGRGKCKGKGKGKDKGKGKGSGAGVGNTRSVRFSSTRVSLHSTMEGGTSTVVSGLPTTEEPLSQTTFCRTFLSCRTKNVLVRICSALVSMIKILPSGIMPTCRILW